MMKYVAVVFLLTLAWGSVYSSEAIGWKPVAQVRAYGSQMTTDTLLPNTPEALAQQQLIAYNARDIDAFLEPYSDTVKIYQIPASEPFLVGKEAMRTRYAKKFEETPELHCELINRMVDGNTVVDQELITGLPDGRVSHAIAIYKVAHGKIVEVHFWRPVGYQSGE